MKLLVPRFYPYELDVLESKGLVPEGYVRFLNEGEERQYLAQSPPSNTLLPRGDQQQTMFPSSGEETPRPPMNQRSKRWISSSPDNHNEEEGGWVNEVQPETTTEDSKNEWNVD
jgi:beta-lactam-binding protein with PASTA domain